MPFSIKVLPLSTFETIQISDSTQNNSIEIVTKGGLLNAWRMQNEQSSINIIAGNDFSNGWRAFEKNGFRSGKMSPFACRLNEGKYSYEGKTYQIEKFYLGDHALHGILYDAQFTIKSTHISESAGTVILQYDYQSSDAGFPFNYSMEVEWKLEKHNKVSVQTTITNHTNHSIPMVDGWHPYFTLGSAVDSYTLKFACAGQLEYDAALLPTGRILSEHGFEQGKLLNGIELDNGYVQEEPANLCTLENDRYALFIQPIKGYSYLQIYTPPNRNSIAIENLSGAPDCFNNKIGLQLVEPYAQMEFATSYQCIVK